jgi:hypothetical protein
MASGILTAYSFCFLTWVGCFSIVLLLQGERLWRLLLAWSFPAKIFISLLLLCTIWGSDMPKHMATIDVVSEAGCGMANTLLLAVFVLIVNYSRRSDQRDLKWPKSRPEKRYHCIHRRFLNTLQAHGDGHMQCYEYERQQRDRDKTNDGRQGHGSLLKFFNFGQLSTLISVVGGPKGNQRAQSLVALLVLALHVQSCSGI